MTLELVITVISNSNQYEISSSPNETNLNRYLRYLNNVNYTRLTLMYV